MSLSPALGGSAAKFLSVALGLLGDPGAADPPGSKTPLPPDSLALELREEEALRETLPLLSEEADEGDLWDALKNGTFRVRGRYRYEDVTDDAFDRDARSSTFRGTMRYESGTYRGVRAVVESETVAFVGNDLFNSTTNGVTDRPVVADPEGTEINQAYLEMGERAQVRVGRQEISLDNHRFVGSVPWRQNFQSFDAISVRSSVAETSLFYAYLHNTNRIFGDDNPNGDARMDSHLVNVSHGWEGLKLTGYWYYLDSSNLAAFSTSTVGARAVGKVPLPGPWKLSCTGEYAQQSDVENNPNDVDAGYLFAEVVGGYENVNLKVGYEVLEGSADAGDKFSTPLATLHKFNGWADQFLVTPDGGLEDLHVSVGGSFDGNTWAAIYHTFTGNESGDDLGTEIDLLFKRPLTEHVNLGIKFAAYDADTFSTDSRRFWVWLDFLP